MYGTPGKWRKFGGGDVTINTMVIAGIYMTISWLANEVNHATHHLS